MKDIKERLNNLPQKSGVYIMLDEFRDILYVGKAKNLKSRIKQYFQASAVNTAKTIALVNKINDFRYIITNNEIEALVLENNLIKKHLPPYNILLKDDKSYPYIRINLKEDFPRIEATRKIKRDKAKYFGPYMLGISIKDMLELLHFAFPLRSCKEREPKANRECLNYHIKRCLAPCTGKISKEEYAEIVKNVMNFLGGNDKDIEKTLKEKMFNAAEVQEFELAKIYKDALILLEKIVRKQVTALSNDRDIDIFTMASNGYYTVINVMVIRGGKLLGSENFSYNISHTDMELSSFIMQYYQTNALNIDEILLLDDIYFSEELAEWLSDKSEKRVMISAPQRGEKKRLIEMSYSNASDYLEKKISKIELKEAQTAGAINQIQEYLSLTKPPRRIECYDISNISGTDKVASMVVFINGEKAIKSYRRFKIKTVEGANDFASMHEVIRRRVERYKEKTSGFEIKPDLIVIDGGKGQLSSVSKILKETDIEVIALAKREEEIFMVESKTPFILSKESFALKLLQQIRDEAHRFAVNYHRVLRAKRMVNSSLTNIEGIGQKYANILLKNLKTIEKIKASSIEELEIVPGIGKKRAKIIYDYFHN